MTARRDVAAEVLDGLREVREYRAGKRTLKTVRVEPGPLPELTPDEIRRIHEDPNPRRGTGVPWSKRILKTRAPFAQSGPASHGSRD